MRLISCWILNILSFFYLQKGKIENDEVKKVSLKITPINVDDQKDILRIHKHDGTAKSIVLAVHSFIIRFFYSHRTSCV